MTPAIAPANKTMRAHHPDYVIALIVTVLLAIGLVIMYSISPILSHKLAGKVDKSYYFVNQLRYVILGVVVWVGATAVSYEKWRAWAPRILVVSVVLLVALFVPGLARSSNGATRWLAFGPVEVQPAEILKVALILYLAAWFERRVNDLKSFWDGVVPFTIMVGAAAFVIVVFQRDMGTMMVMALTALGMFFAAGLRWTHLGALAAAGGAAGWVAIAAFRHRVERLLTFFNPQCNAAGYHICQALVAVGSGGILGLGLGQSIQVYGYLPEAANDSIFAIIAEEFGLIGSVAIIGLFGLLVYRGLQVARMAPDMFSRLVATGISLWLLFQALINIGAMLSLVPLTGIPLPFISYGGTSLVISLFGTGILLNISKYTVREAHDANNRQRRGDSRSYFANPSNGRRVTTAR